MAIPEKTLETINTIIVNWEKAIVVTLLFIILVLGLFPVVMVGFLLGQQTGNIPSAQNTAHERILSFQADQRIDYLSLAKTLTELRGEVNLNRAVMTGLSEDIVYLMRLNCSNTSPNAEIRKKCQMPRWMRNIEESQHVK